MVASITGVRSPLITSSWIKFWLPVLLSLKRLRRCVLFIHRLHLDVNIRKVPERNGTSFSAVRPSLNLLHHIQVDTSFWLKTSGGKHSVTWDESLSDSLFLLAILWTLCGPQSWNNFPSRRPFCSIVKLSPVDGEQRHWRRHFSTRRTNICTWHWDVARRPCKQTSVRLISDGLRTNKNHHIECFAEHVGHFFRKIIYLRYDIPTHTCPKHVVKSKYSPQHLVFNHYQSLGERSILTPIKIVSKIILSMLTPYIN
jgi:hypothetical protein